MDSENFRDEDFKLPASFSSTDDKNFDITLCKLVRWGLSLATLAPYRTRTERNHLTIEFKQVVHILLDKMAKRLPELRGISSTEKHTFFREYKKCVFRLSAWIEEAIEGVSNKENFTDIYDEYLGLLQEYRLITELTAKEAEKVIIECQTNGKAVNEIKTTAETEQNLKRVFVPVFISLLLICLFLLSVWLLPFIPFSWLRNHSNSYSLQGSVIFLIPSVVTGLFKPQWRKWCWGTAAFAFFVLILSLLGGRAR